MSSEMITLRVTLEQKAKLESLATKQGCSVSDVIRGWIDGDQISVEIPQELAEAVAHCAELNEQSVSKFVTEYLKEDHINWGDVQVYQHIGWTLCRCLQENGPMTIEELKLHFPVWAREDLLRQIEWRVAMKYMRRAADGKYELL